MDAWDLIVMFATIFASGVAVGYILCHHRDRYRTEKLEAALWVLEAENKSLKYDEAKRNEPELREMSGSMERLS